MKFYPIRYWWNDRGTEQTGASVASGRDAADALRRFRSDNPHLTNAAVIEKRPTKSTKGHEIKP